MFDVNHLIQIWGLTFVAIVVFSEVGLMVGFFLPGDTLLLSAGIFAAQGKLPLIWTIVVIASAAIAGDNTSFWVGHKLGPRLFRKPNGLLFRQEYVTKAEKFYEIYGNKTALLAHFLPIIRTFSPLLAGVGKMHYPRFVIFDALGDIVWAAAITLLGYFVGTKIPNIDHYVLATFVFVVFVSFGPSAYHLFRALQTRRQSKTANLDKSDQ
ncbi:MAG TPA: DedA family protein [Candidatus Dormibacteraeota bacterium]|nr:DedA family protein [Candidatus Dormibacteraeota bacterium]